MSLTAGQIAAWLGLDSCIDNDKIVSGLSIDSRLVKTGCLFACIEGSRTDGHNYAKNAEACGASVILASKPVQGLRIPSLIVNDVTAALGKIAANIRKLSTATVICITGSAGKTTLKETLKAILSKRGKVLATEKNYNNQLGMPMTIFSAKGDEDFWILEAGISQEGDMDDLAQIARPDIAVIINAEGGHCEGLNKKGVAWNKARLLNYLNPDGIAIFSHDYPELLNECLKYNCKKLPFSIKNSTADITVSECPSYSGNYKISFLNKCYNICTPFSGEYGAEIIASAYAALNAVNFDFDAVCEGLADIEVPDHRFHMEEINGWQIFDDTYNANPLSMSRMLDAACYKTDSAGLVAVLGEMAELGDKGVYYHKELGKKLAEKKIDAIFWTGSFFETVEQSYKEAGGKAPVFFCGNSLEFADCAAKSLLKPKTIFFKGSRCNHLDAFVNEFKKLLNRNL